MGDELIYNLTVDHEEDVFLAVRVWLLAMQKYEATLKKSSPMGTKGGAFIATFPGPDSESTIARIADAESSRQHPITVNDQALAARRSHKRYLYDYFGPSIDTGFRVTSACTPRHFTMSVEVAWAMLLANRDRADVLPLGDLEFLGPRPFKGVWGGRDYPLFAIDRHHDDQINQKTKLLIDGELNLTRAEQLCRTCVTSPGRVSKLYLPQSGDPELQIVPADSLAESRRKAEKGEGLESLPTDIHDDFGSDLPIGSPLA